MSAKRLHVRLPELDGRRSLQWVGIFDALAAELWRPYGEVFVRDAERDREDECPESDDPERGCEPAA